MAPPRAIPPPGELVISEADLRRLLAGRPGISLKEICGALWPQLPWYAGRPGELAATRAPGYPVPPAQIVRAAMDRLVAASEAVEVPRPDEVDALAQVGWTRVGDAPCVGSAPPRISTDRRREPRQRSGKGR